MCVVKADPPVPNTPETTKGSYETVALRELRTLLGIEVLESLPRPDLYFLATENLVFA